MIAVTAVPDGFTVTATSAGAPVAAFENEEKRMAGVQYHPEVLHSPHGQQVLSRFLHETAGTAGLTAATSPTRWSTPSRNRSVRRVRRSAACPVVSIPRWPAALVQRAIGDRLTCVFVDHGCCAQASGSRCSRIL